MYTFLSVFLLPPSFSAYRKHPWLASNAELDSFVGQESSDSQRGTPSKSQSGENAGAFSENLLAEAPLGYEEQRTQVGQPAKQGYLTSILSSLPNLTLSSIRGDAPGQQPRLTPENSQTLDANPGDRRDSVRESSPFSGVAPFRHSQPTNSLPGQSDISFGNVAAPVVPPQPILPPTAPLSADAPVSYRLGNQRRLKYAPPPDLTSSSSQQQRRPAPADFFPLNAFEAPSKILNPFEATVPSQQQVRTEVRGATSPSSKPPSRSSSVQGSFSSSPIAAGTPCASSLQASYHENAPSGSSVSASRSIPARLQEPATPQNTPASFHGFASYRGDPLATPPLAREEASSRDNRSSPPRSTRPLDAVLPARTATSVSLAPEDTLFTPISAAKVSEKLEHLLAEQRSTIDRRIDEESDVKIQPQQEGVNVGGSERGSVDLKEETLSEVSLDRRGQEGAFANFSDLREANFLEAHSHAPQRPYEAQSAASGSSFFAEKLPEQEAGPSYAPPRVAEGSSGPRDSNYRPTVSFFEPPKAFSSFDSSNLSDRFLPDSVEVPQPIGASSVFKEEPAVNFGSNQVSATGFLDSTCGPRDQQQVPLFYNPAELGSEPCKQPALGYPQARPVANQTQQYFGGYVERPFDTIGAGNAVLSTTSSPLMATAVPEPTGSATLSPVQMSGNLLGGRSTPDRIPPSFQNLSSSSLDKRMQYRPVYQHWFYRKEVETKVLWMPFSMQDSLRLEEAHNSSEITPETTVATDGGRYDVDILRRQRFPVYWTGPSTEVRRCSWFYKGASESRYAPYDEGIAAKLEEEYQQACVSNLWNRRIELNNGEYIMFHSATVQVHYSQPSSPELATSWGNTAGAATRPRVIKRGMDEFHIEDGEPEKVDHLLFLVHGIGSVCDLKFRTVEEVVGEFRSISLQLVQSHYRTASERRTVNRIELLPVSWHTTLHSEDTGIDKKLQAITLDSIPKLRHFTNDTLLDILFYTSPIYCQTIMQTVGSELNRLYELFKDRNPDFNGGVYLGGHSLGSLILFDLLCHQKPLPSVSDEEPNDKDIDDQDQNEQESTGPVQPLPGPVLKRRLSKKISYVMGAAGTGQPYIHYPQLNFHPRAFFALGSPIGMFVTVRGIDTLGENFALPTCPAFFNVFHPFDPVAYRMESLINPDAHKFRPMLIPHHKGRKRMHLELKETMARVGADLKQKLLDSVKSTWNSVYQLALFHKPDNRTLEREIDKVVEEQLQKTPEISEQTTNDDGGADFRVGMLNGGRRIDYVLQEAPFEYINEYIFALTSHVCYWESEDTMLMMLKEIYGSTGIQADAQLPPQTLSIERVPPSPSVLSSPIFPSKSELEEQTISGMDPTAPMSSKPVGPPPKAGFVKKS
ncbi:hypothetical protein KM043_006500 [Ampulex compressa]|nr:hypothetical protein KM043_006500 [Ampulex compressa]